MRTLPVLFLLGCAEVDGFYTGTLVTEVTCAGEGERSDSAWEVFFSKTGSGTAAVSGVCSSDPDYDTFLYGDYVSQTLWLYEATCPRISEDGVFVEVTALPGSTFSPSGGSMAVALVAELYAWNDAGDSIACDMFTSGNLVGPQ